MKNVLSECMIVFILLSDDEFIRFKAGDTEVIEKVYYACSKAIYNYLLVKCNRDYELAHDILQETFIAAMRAAGKLRHPGKAESWLMRIAGNKLIDHFRKQGRERKYLTSVPDEEFIDKEKKIDESLILKEQVIFLNLAMEKINPLYKQVITLHCYENKSTKEIAEKIERSAKAVENILFRAREALKKEISQLAGSMD